MTNHNNQPLACELRLLLICKTYKSLTSSQSWSKKLFLFSLNGLGKCLIKVSECIITIESVTGTLECLYADRLTAFSSSTELHFKFFFLFVPSFCQHPVLRLPGQKSWSEAERQTRKQSHPHKWTSQIIFLPACWCPIHWSTGSLFLGYSLHHALVMSNLGT